MTNNQPSYNIMLSPIPSTAKQRPNDPSLSDQTTTEGSEGVNGDSKIVNNDADDASQPRARKTADVHATMPEETDASTTAFSSAINDGDKSSAPIYAVKNPLHEEQENESCEKYDSPGESEQASQQYYAALEETVAAATAAVTQEIRTGAWRCWDTSKLRQNEKGGSGEGDDRQFKIDRESCVLQAVERFASEVILPYFQLAAEQIGVSRSDDQVIMDEATRHRVYVGALLMLKELLSLNMRPIFCAGWYHNYEGYGELKGFQGSADLGACEKFLGSSEHEVGFSANILASGVILSATQKIESDDRERILTMLKSAIASYEGHDDNFIKFHHPTDAGLVECVSYDGKKLGSSHDVAWAVSYNRQFAKHPLSTSSKKSIISNSARPNAIIIYLTDKFNLPKNAIDETKQHTMKGNLKRLKPTDAGNSTKMTNEKSKVKDPNENIANPSQKAKRSDEVKQATTESVSSPTKAVDEKANVKEIDIDIISLT